jgi:GT2 family glycosyltransferase
VIPAWRARATIERCLRALADQRGAPPFEVVLVDSSDDDTAELARRALPDLRLLQLPERTLPGRARNLGVEAARAALIAFTDADCVVPPDWVARHAAAHARDPGAAGVGGSVVNGVPESAVAWSGCLVEFHAFLPSAPAGSAELLPTCNASFRRDVFARHGPFPEDLWPSEDHVFCARLAAAGERLAFEPSLAVRHLFRTRFADFRAHQRRLGHASASARRRIALPQAWLLDSPLRWLVPLFRLARIESRFLRRDLASFARFNLYLPICAAGLVSWGAGFCAAARETRGARGAPR